MKNTLCRSFLILGLVVLSVAACKRDKDAVTGANVVPPPPPMRETILAPKMPVEIIPPPPAQSPAPAGVNAPTTRRAARPMIAIIIDDMGFVNSRQVASLPGPLTLSYLPYPPDIRAQVRRGRAAGDEIMLHEPMEPLDGKLEGGAAFLTTRMSPDALRTAFAGDLAAFDGYAGVNNHMGSRLTQDRAAMDVIMTILKARHLYFVDSRTTPDSVALQSAMAHGVPAVSRDVFLDDVDDQAAVSRQLAEVEKVARRRGLAVAIGHPRPATIAALRAWLPTLNGKGFAEVPVSVAIAARPGPLPVPAPPRE